MNQLLTNILQKRRFKNLRQDFSAKYKNLKRLGKEPFLLPFWITINKQIEAAFLPIPPAGFLSLPAIKNTMFVNPDDRWLQAELDFIKTNPGDRFPNLPREDWVGQPILLPHHRTSANTVHHLYHMYRFQKEVAVKLGAINSVVEWGGGYGNMAKLWYRHSPGVTYTIIDSALFSTIQWLYLTSTLGPSCVNLLDSKNARLKEGTINLVPLALLKQTTINGDLFISTWGLSESSMAAQDYVLKKRWFNSQHLLLGYQKSSNDLPTASRLGQIARDDSAKIIDIDFIPGNYYAFK